MWHPDDYMQQMYEQTEPKYRFNATNEQEWKQWRENLKHQFTADLGGFPELAAELEPVLIEEVACEGYIRKRVEIQTFAGLRMPLYVLEPLHSANALEPAELAGLEKQAGQAGQAGLSGQAEHGSRKLPAVIACHGHGYGGREIVGLTKEGDSNEDSPTYQKNFAIELVKRGFVVIVPELLGFGDRRLKSEWLKDEYSSCHSISTFLLQMGHTMSGHRVYETMRAIDFALTLSQVDGNQIGCMGISGGGLVAGFTAALDERLKAVVVSGYVNTFKSSILALYHCVDNYIPGLNRHAEMPDLIGMIAPRPLLVEAGEADPLFPIDATIESIKQIGKIYRVLNAESQLDTDIFEGDHQISGKVAYDWLVRHLG